jgi:hypothetical protein
LARILLPHLQRLRKYIFFTVIFLTLYLTSCQATQSGTAIPTLELFDLYYSPTLGFLRDDISSCVYSLETIAPYLHERFTTNTSLHAGDVILTLGEVEWKENDIFATQIGSENIEFIVNATNSIATIDMNGLIDIFTGRQTIWQPGSNTEQQITVWVYPDGSDLSNWLLEYLGVANRLTDLSKLAPNPGVVLEVVSKDMGAIGFLPESWMENSDPQITNKIKILRLSDSDDEELSLPVLAYLSYKPIGGVREFLLCLQEK